MNIGEVNSLISLIDYQGDSVVSKEVIRKEKAIPNGMPEARKLKKIGIEEHEQKGVTAPNKEAKIFPSNPLLINHSLIFSLGKKVRKNPITEIIAKIRSIIFMES